jgi:Co/Zn/Cd efflux system component
VGLLLNATLGWSWADPVAGLLIAAVALREGVQAWRGDACCPPLPSATQAEDGTDGCCDGCA